ncbi:MAG: hypothetical protein UW15_C0030G0013 [Parcubacteria group bacterium GW2011_GWC1_44_10]|nr:MAG: hypothetical protein UW15_C0030G0013 [Parcubacteria group bacterium GW2011_GWC1_44_10]
MQFSENLYFNIIDNTIYCQTPLWISKEMRLFGKRFKNILVI